LPTSVVGHILSHPKAYGLLTEPLTFDKFLNLCCNELQQQLIAAHSRRWEMLQGPYHWHRIGWALRKYKAVYKCSCPIHWAIVPDKSGNYQNLGVKGFKVPENERKIKIK